MNAFKAQNSPPLIEWGVAALALTGQPVEPGDQYLVEPFPNGVLVAVVDGLGHGPSAAAVAQTAVAVLRGHTHESVIPLLKRCHEGLKGSRGAVISMASFNAHDGTMTWLGVGNVEGLLLRNALSSSKGANGGASPARESLLLRGGVVGYRLPTLRPDVIPVEPGDTLIFATDGIRSSFAEEPTLNSTPQQVADRILAQYGRGTDDALVLVVRYVGDASRVKMEDAPQTMPSTS